MLGRARRVTSSEASQWCALSSRSSGLVSFPRIARVMALSFSGGRWSPTALPSRGYDLQDA